MPRDLRVVLLRHGLAADRETWKGPDLARPLTRKGEHRARAVGHGLRIFGVRPELVLTSPAVRAIQTAKAVAPGLKLTGAQLHEEETLAPDAAAEDLLDALAALEAREVLCVGHAPHLDQALASLIGIRRGQSALALKKAGAAVVSWNGKAGQGQLRAWLSSAALRRLAKAR